MGPSRTHVRRASMVLSALVAWLLAMASIAYACTLTGPSIRATQVAPDSGGPNTSIIASATGMAARTLYRLEMIDSAVRQGEQCGFGGEISAPVESDPLGDVAPTVATIPETVATGLAEISWVAVATATDRSPVFLFTVVGGDSCGQVLYRSGANTDDNFTPRPGIDTTNPNWPQNGLSTYSVKAKACVNQTKVQVLDRTRLPGDPGLMLKPANADPEHIFITPTDAAGGQARLDQWAATRKTSTLDPFTTAVKYSDVGEERCP